MSDASKEYRFKWRPILHEMSEKEAAQELGERLAEFAGGRSRIEEAYQASVGVDVDGLAAAMGVAEQAARAQADTSGPLPPPGSAVQSSTVPDRYQVKRANEKATARAAKAKARRRTAGA
ncbi:MAG TPA: hypothetical protein VFI17_00960 [Solirubrobacterales bacterium]|nr:hypothetical protein [Solirubrobacterales bacterium]